MRYHEFNKIDEDISRRNILKGLLGAGSLAGAGKAVIDLKPEPAEPFRLRVSGPVTDLEKPTVDHEKQQFQPISKNPQLETYLKQFAKSRGIVGTELAQFLAQVKHETWDFLRLEEVPKGDNYFLKRYDKKYAPRIARILGNTQPGDGEKYYGRGFIQLTGRYNYDRAGKALGIDLVNDPGLAADPKIAAKIAVWYWNTRVKPKVDDFSDTEIVTKYINPGLLGLDKRHNNFVQYSEIV
jgi:predicted chitinase